VRAPPDLAYALYDLRMKITIGRVIEGKIVIEGDPLDEGTVVTVLAAEGKETFELSSREELEILLSIGEADRGETISSEELLTSLQRPEG
jgi:hypothetical protein